MLGAIRHRIALDQGSSGHLRDAYLGLLFSAASASRELPRQCSASVLPPALPQRARPEHSPGLATLSRSSRCSPRATGPYVADFLSGSAPLPGRSADDRAALMRTIDPRGGAGHLLQAAHLRLILSQHEPSPSIPEACPSHPRGPAGATSSAANSQSGELVGGRST